MEPKFKYSNIDLGILNVKIPILEIGKQDSKKRMAITCCIHGNETSSLFIIQSILSAIDENKLKGYMKIILISNPIANFFNGRCSPKDLQDMNRVAPGNNDGSITERVCRAVLNEIILCNYYIDIHEWSIQSLIQCIVMENTDANVQEESKKMIDIFNPDIVTILDSRYINSVYGFLNIKRKIPGFTLELSNNTINNDIEKERIVKSIINILVYLEIYDEQNEYFNNNSYVKIKKVEKYITQRSGLFFPEKKIGDKIKKEDRIGYLLDLNLKDRIELYWKEDKGIVIQMLTKKYVNAGELVYIIAESN